MNKRNNFAEHKILFVCYRLECVKCERMCTSVFMKKLKKKNIKSKVNSRHRSNSGSRDVLGIGGIFYCFHQFLERSFGIVSYF